MRSTASLAIYSTTSRKDPPALRRLVGVENRVQSVTRVTAAALAAALPLVGLISLLLRSELDPQRRTTGCRTERSVQERRGLRVNGKKQVVDAYELVALPSPS